MAGRDLPGPNSLDRKTKFQRNFNQLWWESEREREARSGSAGGEVGARGCCERAAPSRVRAEGSPARAGDGGTRCLSCPSALPWEVMPVPTRQSWGCFVLVASLLFAGLSAGGDALPLQTG